MVLKWKKENSGRWLLICGHENEHMNLKMMQMLIERLAEEGFYEIIFVLLEVHKNKEFVKDVKETLFQDMVISEWKSGKKDDMIKELIACLE